MEAFSDGVIAILITIMVLELHAPESADFSALRPLLPVFISYILSFVFVGIYWNNHHHLLQTIEHVDGGVLWANLHLLFWLSLIPFGASWIGETQFGAVPVALYGVILLGAAVAYYILTRILIGMHDKDSVLAKAVGSDFKGRVSAVIYAVGIPIAFFIPWLAYGLYVCVAIMWLVPDRRIEDKLTD